jgi:hypothetical protein
MQKGEAQVASDGLRLFIFIREINSSDSLCALKSVAAFSKHRWLLCCPVAGLECDLKSLLML